MRTTKLSTAALFSGLVIFGAACSNNAQTEETSGAKATTPSATSEVDTPSAPIDARADSTVTLTILTGDSAVVMLGELKSLDQHIIVTVSVQDKRKLTATLMPLDSSRNIRFSQLMYPDGKTEGPFGKDVVVATSQNGPYKLLITHNLMAEGGLAKEFKLRVALAQ